MARVSVLIPSRMPGEAFLQRTIEDVLAKARGDIDVIPICDGYVPDVPLSSDPRVRPLYLPAVGLRSAINAAAHAATGDYLLKLDAHCMVAEGFDEALKADCDDDWIVVPRRYSLDVGTWGIWPVRAAVDYEYLTYPYLRPDDLGPRIGNVWKDRTAERADVLIDENPTFQGSCYFLKRRYFEFLGPFENEGWGTFILEPEELTNKAWLSGGSVHVNKKTHYAHLHKGKAHGRGYFLSKRALEQGRAYHNDLFLHNGWLPQWPKQVHSYDWLIEKFMPMPAWPADWKTRERPFQRVAC